jgi:putative colanic acid biosynthesis acetyltransferase WcaF
MNTYSSNLSLKESDLNFRHKLLRFIWNIVWGIFVRPIPRKMFNGWKLFLLRLFGAKVHKSSIVYSSARIYFPPNLVMKENAIISSEVDCYNVDKITIGTNSIVSQKVYLCSASHDFTKSDMPLITAPIELEDQVWIAADAFIGMGVTIGCGAVVGARSSVYKNVGPWTVVGGNPARFIKWRFKEEEVAEHEKIIHEGHENEVTF